MEFPGWSAEDFRIFQIEDFDERMERIRSDIQPKLDALGRDMVPLLEAETGMEWFYHVARHMRRSVNPPDDTWVAFNREKRGYKATTHLSLGISAEGANVAVVVKPECAERERFADSLERNAETLQKFYKKNELLYLGDVPRAPLTSLVLARNASVDDWKDYADKIRKVKTYEFEAGFRFPAAQASGWHGIQVLENALNHMRTLMPLYCGGVQDDYEMDAKAVQAASRAPR